MNYLDTYIELCSSFCQTDLATLHNMETVILPVLEAELGDLSRMSTMAPNHPVIESEIDRMTSAIETAKLRLAAA